MLQLWIGRAGTGKSERILETMKRDCRTRGQVLIVPEHVSHEAEVALCRALGDTASRYAEVLSLRNLSGRVLGEVGGLSDFTLDGGGKLLTMRMALQEVGGSLHVFNNPSRRAAFLEQLVALMDELYAYEIAPEEMYVRVQEAPGQRGDKLPQKTPGSGKGGVMPGPGCRSYGMPCRSPTICGIKMCFLTASLILIKWKREFWRRSCSRHTALL